MTTEKDISICKE